MYSNEYEMFIVTKNVRKLIYIKILNGIMNYGQVLEVSFVNR